MVTVIIEKAIDIEITVIANTFDRVLKSPTRGMRDADYTVPIAKFGYIFAK